MNAPITAREVLAFTAGAAFVAVVLVVSVAVVFWQWRGRQ